jgi:hypothetical protein
MARSGVNPAGGGDSSSALSHATTPIQVDNTPPHPLTPPTYVTTIAGRTVVTYVTTLSRKGRVIVRMG